MAPTAPISVAFTILNEERSLPILLRSLDAQTLQPAEIVVVDGGSVDRSVEILNAWSQHRGVPVTCIVSEGASISQGRNMALRRAAYEYVAVTDGGSKLSPEWLSSLYRSLTAGADVASGFFVPSGVTERQKIIAAVITPTLDEIDADRFLPSSRSVAFRRSAVLEAGGYPEWLDYCEDLVLDLELRRARKRFDFVPQAVVEWDARRTLREFSIQYYRYARGDAKARLWPKRHAARFAAYLAGLALLTASAWQPALLAVLALGLTLHLHRPIRRVLHHRRSLGYTLPKAILTAPVVVVVGDVAKLAGYTAGRLSAVRTRDRAPHSASGKA